MTLHPPLAAAAWLASFLLWCACGRPELPPAPPASDGVEAAPAQMDRPPTLATADPEQSRRVPVGAQDAPPPATRAAEAPPPAQMRPLEDLLRLPSSAGGGKPATRPLEAPKSEVPADEKAAKTKERRIQVELGAQSDASVIDPNKARTRTDAGVAVDVGKDTKVRTGVRVEQETGLEREEPHPTVGIERRF